MPEPPAEVVYLGRTYRRHPDSPHRHLRVYYQATGAPRSLLHRDVWAHEHGRPVPAGHDVHHVDVDPLNNAPANLRAMPEVEHHQLHHELREPVTLACEGCGEPFDSIRAWARWCTPACKMRTRRARGLVPPRPTTGPFLEDRTCDHCNDPFIARTVWARFCSAACKQRQLRRDRAAARRADDARQ